MAMLTLEQFLSQERRRLAAFEIAWREGMKSGDGFPPKLESGDWDCLRILFLPRNWPSDDDSGIPTVRDPLLARDLFNIIRQHINERSIMAEPTAQTLAVFAVRALDTMLWKQEGRPEARELLLRAAKLLGEP